MTITGKYHLTATEKRHIQQIIANGWFEGSTKRKSYKMEKTETGYVGVVSTFEKDDWGRLVTRKQSFEVAV
jgi:hypothetical protein